MISCPLCRNSDADDTGSHVVPHFMLKRIFNEEFAKGRDKEIEFRLTSFDVETHFGRSILPEKKEEIMGELTVDEIAKKTYSKLVVDNQWCKTCENKFARLESEYAPTLKKFDFNIYQTPTNGFGALIFWLTIFWRASVTGRMGFRLSDHEQEMLRAIIDDFKFDEPNENVIQKYGEQLNNIGYKVIRSGDYGKVGSTFSFLGQLRRPYSLIVDDFCVFLYLNKKHFKNKQQIFFGFESIKDVPLNTFDGSELIYGLDYDSFGRSMEKLLDFTKDVRMKFYNQKINYFFKEFNYNGPYREDIRRQIISEVVIGSQSLGKKYTLEHFADTATKIFSKHLDELNRR